MAYFLLVEVLRVVSHSNFLRKERPGRYPALLMLTYFLRETVPHSFAQTEASNSATRKLTPTRDFPLYVGKRAFVIDDDPEFRTAFLNNLQALGIDAEGAISGEIALKILESQFDDFEVIFIDLALPGIKGDEVYDQLMKWGCQRRIVLMTSAFESAPAVRSRDRNLAVHDKQNLGTHLRDLFS